MKLIPQSDDGYSIGVVSFEADRDGLLKKATVETFNGTIEITVRQGYSPFSESRLAVKHIPAPITEDFSDAERLNALIARPDLFWKRSLDGGGTQFCGNGLDWRNFEREALNDLIRHLRAEESSQNEAQACYTEAAQPE